MKVKYTQDESTLPKAEGDNLKKKGRSLQVQSLRVGHTASEMYISFGEESVIMTPAVSKKMLVDLNKHIDDFETEYGKIKLKSKPKKHKESTATKIAKSLYKSKKLGPRLLSINTKKRKHLPFGGKGDKS